MATIERIADVVGEELLLDFKNGRLLHAGRPVVVFGHPAAGDSSMRCETLSGAWVMVPGLPGPWLDDPFPSPHDDALRTPASGLWRGYGHVSVRHAESDSEIAFVDYAGHGSFPVTFTAGRMYQIRLRDFLTAIDVTSAPHGHELIRVRGIWPFQKWRLEVLPPWRGLPDLEPLVCLACVLKMNAFKLGVWRRRRSPNKRIERTQSALS